MRKNGKNTVLNAPEEKNVYPPTPAFTKAGAAPGITAGVEPVFAGLPLPCRSPAPTPKPSAAASTRYSDHCPLLLRAFKPAVCQPSGHLGPSSLPFASRQMPKISRGSFDQALSPQAFVVRALKFKPAFASPQMPKMSHGSFDQALWPQEFVVRAFKPAVCLHGLCC